MLTKFPIRYVVVEGPDLSGKSTFIRHLHKTTGFRYNIQDRSCLSMMCFARQYCRDEESQRQFLKEELSDLNNFYIVLLPSEEVLLDRLAVRGDEFQNPDSLIKLRKLFEQEVATLSHLPNIIVIRNTASPENLAEYISHKLKSYENSTPEEVGQSLAAWVDGVNFNEEQLKFKINIDIQHDDSIMLSHSSEGEYYTSILEKCCQIIKDETAGKNQYNTPQDLNSRRFYYSSDSCISSIHFLPRDGKLKVVCNLRSTDVRQNGAIDTRFLTHLSAHIPRTFNWPVTSISLVVSFNSAHVRKDKNAKIHHVFQDKV